jgi:predicted nucleic acid-binding Zn ribbon protein
VAENRTIFSAHGILAKHTGAYQTDWKRFSKEKFMQSSSAETEKPKP